MKGLAAIEARQRRLSIMEATLRKALDNGIKVSKKKFIAVACGDLGISKKLCLEYVEILEEKLSVKLDDEI